MGSCLFYKFACIAVFMKVIKLNEDAPVLYGDCKNAVFAIWPVPGRCERGKIDVLLQENRRLRRGD